MLMNVQNTIAICIRDIKNNNLYMGQGFKNNHLKNKQNWKILVKKAHEVAWHVYIFHDNSTGVKQHKV